MYEGYHPLGVNFVGLTEDGDDELDEVKAFVESFGITWSNGYGAAKLIADLRVGGFPTMFVIGADGKVLWHDELGGTLEEALDAALWLRDHPE